MACYFNTDKETDWAVFGGHSGTGNIPNPSNASAHDYRVYAEYFETVARAEFVGGATADKRRLTDAQFRGDF